MTFFFFFFFYIHDDLILLWTNHEMIKLQLTLPWPDFCDVFWSGRNSRQTSETQQKTKQTTNANDYCLLVYVVKKIMYVHMLDVICKRATKQISTLGKWITEWTVFLLNFKKKKNQAWILLNVVQILSKLISTVTWYHLCVCFCRLAGFREE